MSTVEATGYIVAIRMSKDAYLCKDIAELSNIEFLLWLSQVYPVDLTKSVPEEYSKIETRMAYLKMAMDWHQVQLFIPRKG